MGQDKAPQRKTYRQLELPALRRLQLAEETGVDAEIFSPHDNRVPEAEFGRLIENCIGVMPVPPAIMLMWLVFSKYQDEYRKVSQSRLLHSQ